MKILNPRDGFLSNYEVLTHLKDIQSQNNWTPNEDAHNNHKKRYTACGIDLEVITRDVVHYLVNTETGEIDSKESFTNLLLFLNNFALVKIEKLQIVNLLPRSMVSLYSIVEECDTRLTEEQCESILAKINELFPSAQVEEEEEEEGEQQEDIEQEDGVEGDAYEEAA